MLITLIIILLLIADYFLYKIAYILDKQLLDLKQVDKEEAEVIITGKKYKIVSPDSLKHN